jgi:hypothetical protein
MSIKNGDNTLEEYEERFNLKVTTRKGSPITIENILLSNLRKLLD